MGREIERTEIEFQVDLFSWHGAIQLTDKKTLSIFRTLWVISSVG